MKYLTPFFILFVLVSCHKTSQSLSDADILMSHAWYPYQVHITTVDSNSVAVTDSTGQVQVQSQVINWDTTVSPTSCASQSTYTFMQNGVLQINDACNSGTLLTEGWTITQTNFLEFSSPEIYNTGAVNYELGGYGLVTQINNGEFTFNNQQSIEQFYSTSYGPNHSIINTHDNIASNVFTTYKSK